MPAPRKWTIAEHARIIEGRARNESWETIGDVLGIHKTTIVNYAKKAGIWTPNITFHGHPENAPSEVPEREWWPLPAGHPTTWGAICAGTTLGGAEYPQWR